MAYDPSNLFAKILRGEIPSMKIYEDDHVLAFHDAFPKAPVHALIVPKGAYTDIEDFSARGSEAELLSFARAIPQVVEALGLKEKGFRVVANTGADGGQEVPHYHLHVLGGKAIGPIVAP